MKRMRLDHDDGRAADPAPAPKMANGG